ncbi:metallophosphoesterase [Paenibacillus spiritus]|uniref:Phosphoesterase n=1 Tax=Paenibacillus spiritus TaxID=2496557 RepID=A0A5J5GM12_9BACL|nr:metallophosphoesterase [Paenibacillus spiritus]KAA9008522.1 metallophosphoesterase [Paenibacillus spiritus]
MRIGVVSDTHISRTGRKLPETLIRSLEGADLILHLGDWVIPEVYDMLAELAPVEGIAGNNDGPMIVSRFGERKILELDGLRFGLVHGHYPYSGQGTPGNALLAFRGESLDCILFGHSHQPLLRRESGLLLFNPGSPTDKRREKRYSFGLLETGGREIRAEHIFYDSRD